MLIQEVDINDDPGVLGLNPFDWMVAPLTTGNGSGYGISRFGLIGSSGGLMTATEVNSLTFYATQEEFNGSRFFTLSNDANGGNIGQILGLDEPFWQGDTEFFFGNITTKKACNNYIRSVRFFIEKDYLNTTINPTYTSGSTFISEIYMLSSDNKILGIAKPDRPIEKNDTIMIDLALNSYY